MTRTPLRTGLVALILCVAASAWAAPGSFEGLAVSTASGKRELRVEVMRTDADRARGMMFRTEMPAGTGMLFEMPREGVATFWMKDTPLPLDMVFIRRDGTVDSVAADAVPLSTAVVPSRGPVTGVLEIPGGEAARLGIAPGDRVSHPFFDRGAPR